MANQSRKKTVSGSRRQSSPSKNEARRTKIAIVGAGIAGLYCGYLLHSSGKRDFLIAEESNHIGGRIWSTRVMSDGSWLPDDQPLSQQNGANVEFCAEFGPMRIELQLQTLLSELIKDLDLEDELEPFPPYESPTSEHDPKYELEGEEADQATPLDLLKLAIIRIFGRLRKRQNSLTENQSGKFNPDEQNRMLLDQKLHRLIEDLSCAVATRQPNWKDVLLQWAETLNEPDYQNIRQYGIFDDGTEKGTPLWSMGFWNLLSEVLSHHAVMKIRDLGTFYHLIPENPNAAEWLIFWLRAFRTSEQLVGIRGGMQCITEKIVKRIGRPQIKLGHKLMRLAEGNGNKVKLTFENGAQWEAEHVILALPTAPLLELAKLNERTLYQEMHRDLTAVFGFPLLKFFVTVKERWWDEDAASTNRYATLIPTRELHYRMSPLKVSKKGLILLYTDRPATTFWSNYIKHDDQTGTWTQADANDMSKPLIPSGIQSVPELGSPESNPRLINKLLQYLKNYAVRKKPGDLEFYGIRDWGREPYLGAAHAWYPERQSWEIFTRLSAFAIGSYSRDEENSTKDGRNMHICGEAYSDYHGFIEGALRSAKHVLHMIDPKTFKETPTPWLCGENCSYSSKTDADNEIARLRGEKACANAEGVRA